MRRLIVLGLLLPVSCNDLVPTTTTSTDVSTPIGTALTSLSASAAQDAGRVFWRSRPEELVWASIVRGDGVANVGLRAAGKERGVEAGRPALSSSEQSEAVMRVRTIPGIEVLDEPERLPIVRVRVSHLDGLRRLRALPTTDYVEPEVDFEVPVRRLWQNSCSGSGWAGSTSTIEPGDILPANYSSMRIPDAWTRSSGAGITVGLVDTGLDPVQPQFNGQFNDGMSNNGRTLTRTFRRGSDAIDHCGHGTHMASAIAAPRDGRNTLGVAWGANLFTVRVNSDPLLDGTNVTATRLGIADAASVSRIIVLAFGSPNPWQSVTDEIAYWYHNWDRLFVGAAGTGFPWLGVYFPATLPTVTAVSGTDCPACHYGTKVDFVTPQGQPATGAVYLGHPDLGVSSQSSNATAVIAGLAALVWARDSMRSRSSVLSMLINAHQQQVFATQTRAGVSPMLSAQLAAGVGSGSRGPT